MVDVLQDFVGVDVGVTAYHIDDVVWCVLLSEDVHRHCSVALRQSLPFVVAKQRQVDVFVGCREVEYLLNVSLYGGGQEEVFAANDLCHAHESVVYSNGELVCPCVVASSYDKVTAGFGEVDVLFAEVSVDEMLDCIGVDMDVCRVGRNEHPESFVQSVGVINRLIRATCSGVYDVSVVLVWCLCRHDVGASTSARVYQAEMRQCVQRVGVYLMPLTLIIRLVVRAKT